MLCLFLGLLLLSCCPRCPLAALAALLVPSSGCILAALCLYFCRVFCCRYSAVALALSLFCCRVLLSLFLPLPFWLSLLLDQFARRTLSRWHLEPGGRRRAFRQKTSGKSCVGQEFPKRRPNVGKKLTRVFRAVIFCQFWKSQDILN